jgi:hypothetical protein
MGKYLIASGGGRCPRCVSPGAEAPKRWAVVGYLGLQEASREAEVYEAVIVAVAQTSSALGLSIRTPDRSSPAAEKRDALAGIVAEKRARTAASRDSESASRPVLSLED